MAANRLKQSDLPPVFGSKSRVSEVVNGKRDISKEQAKKLASFFHVSADLFI
jgi:HTH-type transcriptional regulator / antitoxin HigA